MKRKNFKSAIHNFSDSFHSVDYSKSGVISLNTLFFLHSKKETTKAKFNFLTGEIYPTNASTKSSQKLISDYMNWLPKHLERQNCDLKILEKLEIEISTDLSDVFEPQGMNDSWEFETKCITTWKIEESPEEILELKQTHIAKKQLIKSGFPEL